MFNCHRILLLDNIIISNNYITNIILHDSNSTSLAKFADILCLHLQFILKILVRIKILITQLLSTLRVLTGLSISLVFLSSTKCPPCTEWKQ